MHNLFGTDGIRGRVGEYPMDGQTLDALGLAIVKYLGLQLKAGIPRVVIARDTRISSAPIEAFLSELLVNQGVEVYLIGVLPTPAVPRLIRFLQADLGLMISASHNPYFDNGVKIFDRRGIKLAESEEILLTQFILSKGARVPLCNSSRMKGPFSFVEGRRLYMEALQEVLSMGQVPRGLVAVVDSAHGATWRVVEEVFQSAGMNLHVIGNAPDGFNINDHCGALYPESCARAVLESGANIGIALDGDGDRCVLVDELGKVLSGDEVLGICSLDCHERGQLVPPIVVSTVLANIGLEMALYDRGISLLRTAVGDRQVLMRLIERRCVLGGEPSGHFIFLNMGTTGDGIVAALQVLGIMARTGQPLSELRRSIRLFPQVFVNVPVKQKVPLANFQEISEVISSVESALHNRGRVLVRYSGTESVARVMLEGEDMHRIQFFCDEIASVLDRQLNA